MKLNFKTVVLLFLFIASGTMVNAQYVKDGYGHVVSGELYSDYKGNPYINADWAKGDVTLNDGSVQKDLLLKYDEIKDLLYVQGKGNIVVQFEQPVTSFTITLEDGKTARFSVMPGNGKLPDNNFFEVLCDGKTKLLKRNAKSISESKEMGSGVINRTVVDNIDYYLLIAGKLVRIKKDKKSVLSALADKQTELENYIKANNLNLKNDADLAKLITQYNTL